MNDLRKYLCTCLLATAALLVGASPAWAQVSLGTASSFAVLGGPNVTCTDSTVTGDVGSAFPGSKVTQTTCTIIGGVHEGDGVAKRAYDDFLIAYAALAPKKEDNCTIISGDLAGQTLVPGVYCVEAASTTTDGVLTLDGPANGIWIFKIGTSGTGALTGTRFSVVMADRTPPACNNVYWWVAEAATMTDSRFVGTILAGAAITITRGTFTGRALAKAAVTLTGATVAGCGGGTTSNPPRQRCNQGVGNGPEGCDPGNSNQDGHNSNPFLGSLRSNDELPGAEPGNPCRKGGKGGKACNK